MDSGILFRENAPKSEYSSSVYYSIEGSRLADHRKSARRHLDVGLPTSGRFIHSRPGLGLHLKMNRVEIGFTLAAAFD